jgi:regulatory protein
MTSTRKTDSLQEPGPEKSRKRLAMMAEKARTLCATREYCISDIRNKLGTWGVADKEETEEIIRLLVSERFIDEQRYASAYARDKLRYNKWGKIKIRYSLNMKGLPGDCIREALECIDEGEYLDIATKLIQAMVKSKKAESSQLLREKVLRSMQAKGFEYEVTGEIVSRLI